MQHVEKIQHKCAFFLFLLNCFTEQTKSVSLNRKSVVTAASLQHTLHTAVYGAAVNEGKHLKFLQFWMEYILAKCIF